MCLRIIKAGQCEEMTRMSEGHVNILSAERSQQNLSLRRKMKLSFLISQVNVPLLKWSKLLMFHIGEPFPFAEEQNTPTSSPENTARIE